MREVASGLWIGDAQTCQLPSPRLVRWVALIHAAKSPCHQAVVGYTGSLPSEHKEYLVARRGSHLILNLIDPPIIPLFKLASFTAALDFLDEAAPAPDRKVLVHCNQGLSRAPSLALLWLAKRAQALPAESFEAARAAYLERQPDYAPGLGLVTFLTEHWAELA